MIWRLIDMFHSDYNCKIYHRFHHASVQPEENQISMQQSLLQYLSNAKKFVCILQFEVYNLIEKEEISFVASNMHFVVQYYCWMKVKRVV